MTAGPVIVQAEIHSLTEEPHYIFDMLQHGLPNPEMCRKVAKLLLETLVPDFKHRISAAEVVAAVQEL